MKVWAKTIKDEHITSDATTIVAPFEYVGDFVSCMHTLCGELDIPTPIILTKHITHYVQFTNCHFLPGDFVEAVNFDKLVIENITE